MSDLQDWTRTRNLDKGHISRAIEQLRACKSLTYREKAIAYLCADYLDGTLHRWEIRNPTSKREYMEEKVHI